MAAQQLLQSLGELASASGGQALNLRSTVGAFISAALAISRIPAEKLLDDLLKEFLKGENDGQGPSRGQSGSSESLAVVSAFVIAAMHLLEKEGTTDQQLERLVCHVCLPALSARGNPPVPPKAEIASSLAALISARGAWACAETALLPACKAALLQKHTSTDTSQSDMFLGETQTTLVGAGKAAHEEDADVSDRLAAIVACHLAADLIRAAAQASSKEHLPTDLSSASEWTEQIPARAFLTTAVAEILPVAFDMLTDGSSTTQRRHAISTLLPALLDVAPMAKGVDTAAVGEQLWDCCKELLGRDRGQKADGFAVIACFKGHLLPSAGSERGNEDALLDVRERPAFWEAIKGGLLDDDSLIRRQALQVLRLALPSTTNSTTSSETGPPERWVERGADGPASTSAPPGPVQKYQEGGSLSKTGMKKEWQQSRKRDAYAAKDSRIFEEVKSL